MITYTRKPANTVQNLELFEKKGMVAGYFAGELDVFSDRISLKMIRNLVIALALLVSSLLQGQTIQWQKNYGG